MAGTNLKRVGWQQLRADMSGALVSTLVTLAPMMAMGVIAFAPLGSDYLSLGIVASLMPGVILTLGYALFGGSSNLLAGPRAAVSLVFAATLGSILAMDPIFAAGADRAAAALALTLIATIAAGILLIVLGLCRVGQIIKFVPFPVTAGFLNSAAVLIILSQIHVIFEIPDGVSLLDTWRYVDGHTAARFTLGLITVLACFLMPKLLPGVSGLITGGIVGVGAYHAGIALGLGMDLGATMPAFPALTFDPRPLLDFFGFIGAAASAAVGDPAGGGVAFLGMRIDGATLPLIVAVLVPSAVSLAFLQSLDALFAAVALEDLTQNRFDAGRDLIVLGCGSVLCGGLGYLSGSGSYTRTVPAYAAGARTAWSGVATAAFTLISIFLFAPLVGYIPNVVVAGVLFVLAVGIVDRWTLDLLKKLWTGGRATERAVVADLAIVGLVVATAIAFGLIEAVGVGVMVAIANFVTSIGKSPVRRTYRGDAVSSFLQRGDFSAALLREHGDRLGVLELEGPFFFGSAGRVEHEVDALASAGVDHVILDMKRVNAIDSTAARTLFRLARRLERAGKTLAVSYVRTAAGNGAPALQHSMPHENWVKLAGFGAVDSVGRHNFFPDTDTAMRHCEMLLVDAIAQDGKTPVAAWPTTTGLFDTLGEGERGVLHAYAEECRYAAGSTVFEQGDPGDALYVVLDGMVDAIVRQEPGGHGIRVNSMSKGAVFGEMAILDPQPRSATIVAVEDTTCLRIGASALERLNAEHPALGLRLMKFMCLLFTTRLRLANLAIIELES